MSDRRRSLEPDIMETWTDDASVQLIELYQNNPLIWDPKHEDYYKKQED